MDISRLSEKILIQKKTIAEDEIGNHQEMWEDYHYFFCHVSDMPQGGINGDETSAAGQTLEEPIITFTVRCSKDADAVKSTGFRVIFHDDFYNIVSVDHMNYDHKSIKLRCRRVWR